MDNNFTQLIKTWVETPKDERDYAVGALYLLRLSGNKIMYTNLMARDPRDRADFIETQMQKYLSFRLAQLTHEEVKAMESKVERIVKAHIPTTTEADKNKKGKRDDHDSLPDEIKALYVENLSLLQKMRDLHLKLRMLSTENATCPDSERYPFLKELIKLDKKLHANWKEYDQYVAE